MIRLTTRGFGLLSTGVVLLIAASATGVRAVAWPGGLLIGLVLAAGGLTWFSARRPTLRRRLLPDRLAAGSPMRVQLDLQRDSIGAGAWSVVEETVPPELTGAPALAVPSGWGGLRSVHEYQLGTTVRGRYRVGPGIWVTTDPLGLASSRRGLGGTSLLTVTPAVHRLGTLGTAAGAGLTGESAQRSSSLLGADDALIREYRPRDELRRIHWPSTARMGSLMVRREEHAWEPSALILLDNRSGAYSGGGSGSSFEWAVSAAASIGVHLLDAGFDVELTDASGRTLAPEVGASAREVLLDHLTDVHLSNAYELSGALMQGIGGRGNLLIAVLGRLSTADAMALTNARTDGRLCRALILHAPDGSGTDPAELLVADGWQVVRDAASRSVADACAGFGWSARG